MREIALDTETTGISPRDGHRIIEIGALELMHHLPTGRKLHLYINPERDIDDGAVAVHGITSDFLVDKPVFADIVDEFLAFVGDDPMVIHNASFDMGFINAELKRLDRPPEDDHLRKVHRRHDVPYLLHLWSPDSHLRLVLPDDSDRAARRVQRWCHDCPLEG